MGFTDSFTAGWNYLTTEGPGAFVSTLAGGDVQGAPAQIKSEVPKNLGGSANPNPFALGTAELFQDPVQFAVDLAKPVTDHLPSPPSSATITTWLIVGVVGLLAIAYIAHEA